MSMEVPQQRFDFREILRRLSRKPKIWTPEKVKREGFIQNVAILKGAVHEVLAAPDPDLQERLNFLAGLPSDSKEGFTVEVRGEKIITKAFKIGLGEKENLYFVAQNPREEGEEIHKFVPYGSITTKEELLKTIRGFILLEPTDKERVKVSRDAIRAEIEKYNREAAKVAKTPTGFQRRTMG